MYKKVCLMLCILLLITIIGGCGKSNEVEVSMGEFQKNMHGGDFAGSIRMCSSDKAYHIVVENTLYYVDKASMKAIISCAKPECTHMGDDFKSGCNASLGLYFCYYSKKLYYFDLDYKTGLFSLNSADLDGTNRKAIQALVTTKTGSTRLSKIPFAIHKGKSIFQSAEGDFPRGANVYVGTLGTDAKKSKQLLEYETFYATKGATYSTDPIEVWDMWADGDYFYYVGETKKEDNSFKQVVYRYDPQSEENRIIWETPEPEETGEWSDSGVRTNGWYITGGVFYYFLSGNGVWKCDLDTGINEQVVAVTDEMQRGTAAFDDEYIYINNGNENSQIPFEDRAIYVYDYQGKYIGSISCGAMYTVSKYLGAYKKTDKPLSWEWTGIIGADKENVFIVYTGDGENYGIKKVFSIRKENIASNKYEQIIETYFEGDPITGKTYEYKS